MSSKRSLSTRFRVICACGLVTFSLSACGSKSSDDTTTATETTATTEAAATETTAAATDTTATAPEPTAAPEGAALVQGVILTDGEAPAERTITVVGQAFEPGTLTVKVGDTVTFKAGDKRISAVIVGDLSGATVTGGLVETFQFSIPGTYPVKEDVSGNTATIIVE
jgi:plastocyanin